MDQDVITEDIETNAERNEREAFEALTPQQQAQTLEVLLRQFMAVPSYVERYKLGK